MIDGVWLKSFNLELILTQLQLLSHVKLFMDVESLKSAKKSFRTGTVPSKETCGPSDDRNF